MDEIRYCFRRDDDSHWYMIPIENRELFSTMLDVAENDFHEAFNSMFDRYRLGGGPESLSFEHPLEV